MFLANSEMNEKLANVNNLTRQLNCSLNPTAQIDKIINYANLPNFTVEVNNSGYNVNIRCNSGTYAKVVKPTILTFDKGFSATSTDFICKLDSKLHGIDQHGLLPECPDSVPSKVRQHQGPVVVYS